MIIYYYVFAILCVSVFMSGKNRRYALIAFVLFSVIYIFRARVGSDYPAYKNYYEMMDGFKDWSVGGCEPGYNFMALLFHKMGAPFQFMWVCLSAFVIYLYYSSVRKLNIELGVVTLMALYYIFYPTLEVLRQGIALILFFYSITYLIDQNPYTQRDNTVKFFAVNIVGALFHRTALLAFIFYFFQKKKIIKLCVCCGFMLFAVAQPVILGVLRFFPLFYNRYRHYIWVKSISEESSVLSLKLIEYLFAWGVLIFVFIKNNKSVYWFKGRLRWNGRKNYIGRNNDKLNESIEKNETKDMMPMETISLNLIEIGILVQVFVAPVIASSYRMVYFCNVGIILFFSLLYKKISNGSIRFFYCLALCVYIGARLGRIFPFDNDLFIYHLFA